MIYETKHPMHEIEIEKLDQYEVWQKTDLADDPGYVLWLLDCDENEYKEWLKSYRIANLAPGYPGVLGRSNLDRQSVELAMRAECDR